jgi:hypothetical protein
MRLLLEKEKRMNIIDLLANNNYIIANKTIAQLYGLEEAVLLGELASEYKYWENRGELKDGFFFSTIENIKENTTLSDKRQRSALSTLKNAGIVKVKLMGIPAKRYIKIEVEQLFRALDSKINKNGETSFAKTAELEQTEWQSNNNNLNNNKNNNKKDIGEEPKRKRFVPPTIEEVKAYCIERKNNVDAQRFIDYYTSNGWCVGKNKMKDWRAAVRTWERNGYSTQKTVGANGIAVKQEQSDLLDMF